MQTIVDCWANPDCGEEFVVESPSRGSDEIIEGVSALCTFCAHPYVFTLDGDGEPDLQDAADNESSLGENITGFDADSSTNY